MTLPQHIQYWLLRQHKMVAAEVASTLPGHRAWVGVYPPRPTRDTFIVRYFEVDHTLIEQDLDIHEEQLQNKEKIYVRDEEELVVVLSRWLTSLDSLKDPSFCDYPI